HAPPAPPHPPSLPTRRSSDLPLPPPYRARSSPSRVSPGPGMRATRATTSVFTLPTTTTVMAPSSPTAHPRCCSLPHGPVVGVLCHSGNRFAEQPAGRRRHLFTNEGIDHGLGTHAAAGRHR